MEVTMQFINSLIELSKSIIISKKKKKKKKKKIHEHCWICNKLFINEDKKVRDHDHTTEKYRGSAYPDCNINLKLTK